MLTKLTVHAVIATVVVGLFAFAWQAAASGAAGPKAGQHADARQTSTHHD